MNSWTRVIIEWANCLGIVDSRIECMQDLKDEAFYEKLVFQLCRGNDENHTVTTVTQEERELVSKFIQAEYPDFGRIDRTLEHPDELYAASLLLIQCSQQPTFHRPMCSSLRHETQIRIKQFLETVLPSGKSLTKESLAAAIAELEDSTSSDASLTPVNRPLREFFDSPAVKSARARRFMNDRNRELMRLRAELETERFEKADLAEDLKSLNEKVSRLQKMLDDKTRELRESRLERSKPPTPQSCRKARRPCEREERYRRDVESLEIANSRLMLEIEKLRDDRDSIARRLTASETFGEAIREKYEKSEATIERLLSEMETRDEEILDLRANNEELREHARHTRRSSYGERSFDAVSTCDEALSTIVDIQLQEAREESSRLKVQLAELRFELEKYQRDCEKSNENVEIARRETEDARKIVSSKEADASMIEKEREKLATMLDDASRELRDALVSFTDEQISTRNLRDALASLERKYVETETRLRLSEKQNLLVNEEKRHAEANHESIVKKLERTESRLCEERALLEDSESRLVRANGEIDDLNALIETREELLKNEKTRFAELRATYRRGESEFERMRVARDQLKIALQTETKESEKLRDIACRSRQAGDELESLLRSRDALLEESAEREATLKENLKSCESKLNDLRESLLGETARSDELRTRLILAKKNCDEIEVRLAAKDRALTESEVGRNVSKAELSSANERIDETESNLEDLRRELVLLREERRELASTNEKLEESLRVADERIVGAARRISVYEKRTRDLDESMVAKTKKLDEIRHELTEIIAALDSSNRRLVEAEKRESAMAEALGKSDERIAELIELGEAANDELSREIERTNALQRENEKLGEKVSDFILSTNDLERRINDRDIELEEARKNLQKESALNEEFARTIESSNAISMEFEEKLRSRDNDCRIVSNELASLKEELTARASETSTLKERLESARLRLEERDEKLAVVILDNEELARRVQDLRGANVDLDEKLTRATNKLSSASCELDDLKDELASRLTELSIAKERVDETERRLAESRECMRKESSFGSETRKELEVWRATNVENEEKLARARERLSIVSTERDYLRTETSSMRIRLDKAGMKIAEVASNLQKQIEANSEMSERELESDERLTEERERVKEARAETARLKNELSSLVRSNAALNEETSALREELADARKIAEVSRESERECAKLRERVDGLIAESKKREEETRSLESAFEAVKLEKERSTERAEAANVTVVSLEKRLLAAEKAREEFELEEKLKEEALGVVRARLEQLGKEKLESELRSKEATINLREVRASQDCVLEAQVRALEEKSRRLANAERDLERTRISLAEKRRELESEKLRTNIVATELENVREKSSKESSLLEELKDSLESERAKVRETTKICDISKTTIGEIVEASKVLNVELNSLWNSVRAACPELARSKNVRDANDDATTIVASFVEDARTIRRVVSILGEANEALKEHLDGEKETTRKVSEESKKRNIELDERLSSVESELEKRDRCLSLLANRKRNLQGLLSRVVAEREKVDRELGDSTKRWNSLDFEARNFLTTLDSESDEFERLRGKYDTLKDLMTGIDERRVLGAKNFVTSLCRIFLWSEATIREIYDAPSLESPDEFSPETALSVEIQRDEDTRKDLVDLVEKLNEFADFLVTRETKTRASKASSSNDEKLRAELEKISKERKELKDKLDAARVRNAKMEKNMDELRSCNKKLRMDLSVGVTSEERSELERLRELTKKLEAEREELSRRMNEKGDVDARLETLHNEYGLKLDKIKQKMKTAYNEQVARLNQEQERVLRERMESLRHQTEQQCRKYTDDIAKYKAHISDLSSRYWDVGEKLLAETQEKQSAIQQLQRLKGQQQQQEAIAEINEHVTQNRQKTSSLDRREFSTDRPTRDSNVRAGYRAVEVIEEETTTFSTRRHSVKSIQAMGNAFDAEDEEGEVFDGVYLADLKEGRCAPPGPDFNRLSELRMRNSLCRPHLKSSYAVETHLQPVAINEDDIKNGVTVDDVFNDSLSQSLLPGQKPKKKDRTQTSYKRPGPPTPSKNGGRLSLQGNELKSPNGRILKERNVDRRTTATPRGLKNLFGTSTSRRQDENTAGTPKGRRLSNIFRKQRNERN